MIAAGNRRRRGDLIFDFRRRRHEQEVNFKVGSLRRRIPLWGKKSIGVILALLSYGEKR